MAPGAERRPPRGQLLRISGASAWPPGLCAPARVTATNSDVFQSPSPGSPGLSSHRLVIGTTYWPQALPAECRPAWEGHTVTVTVRMEQPCFGAQEWGSEGQTSMSAEEERRVWRRASLAHKHSSARVGSRRPLCVRARLRARVVQTHHTHRSSQQRGTHLLPGGDSPPTSQSLSFCPHPPEATQAPREQEPQALCFHFAQMGGPPGTILGTAGRCLLQSPSVAQPPLTLRPPSSGDPATRTPDGQRGQMPGAPGPCPRPAGSAENTSRHLLCASGKNCRGNRRRWQALRWKSG